MSSSVLITGANGSLAVPGVQHLLTKYPNVKPILTVRNESASDPNTRRLLETTKSFQDRVSLRPLDLADLSAVHKFANELASEIASGTVPPLSGIICNAFYWNLTGPPELSKDGFEKTFQVNHLAHAALILRLLGSCSSRARIVVFASDAHFPGKNSLEKYPPGLPGESQIDSLVHPDSDTGTDYMGHGFQRYANSKLAIVAWMYALNRRLHRANTHANGITAIAVNPGNLTDSRALASNTPITLRIMSRLVIKPLGSLLRILVDPTMRKAQDAGVDVIELTVGKDFESAEGYYTLLKKDESSVESNDESKQELLWKKTLQWAGIEAKDVVIAI